MRPIAIGAGLLLAAPAAASAHVTIAPATAAPGYTVEAFRVPNEKSDEATTKVAVKFPEGFASARPAVVTGWSAKVETAKLAKPIETDDGPIDEGVSTITWTADTKAAAIPAGEYQDFPVEVLLPDTVGKTLTFKALQTYSGGDVVRWIGTPDADEPAPTLKLTAATGTTAAAAPVETPAGGTSASATSSDDGGSGNGLAIAALVVAVLALLATVFLNLRPTKKELA